MASRAASDQPFGQCRCCLGTGYHKDISLYRQMFLDCFNLRLSTNRELISKICMFCISRLNDAREFRALVAESERHLLALSSIKATANNDFVNVAQHDQSDNQEQGTAESDDNNVTIKQEYDNDCVIVTKNVTEKIKGNDGNDCVVTENKGGKRKGEDEDDRVFTENKGGKRKRGDDCVTTEKKKEKRKRVFLVFEDEINDSDTMDNACNAEIVGDSIDSINEDNDINCNEEIQNESNVTDTMEHDDDSNMEGENIVLSKEADNDFSETETADNDVCINDENEMDPLESVTGSQENVTATQIIESQSGSSLPPSNRLSLNNRASNTLKNAGDMVSLSSSKSTNKHFLSRSITMKVNKTKGTEVDKTTSESCDRKSNESQANLTQDKPGNSSSGSTPLPTKDLTLNSRATKRLEIAGNMVSLSASKSTNRHFLSRSITMKVNKTKGTEVDKTTSESCDPKSNESQANLTQDKPGNSSSGSTPLPTTELTLKSRAKKSLEIADDTDLLSPSKSTSKHFLSRSITMKVNKTKGTEVDKTTSESCDLKSNESQANLTQDKPGNSSSGSTPLPTKELILKIKRLETTGDMVVLSASKHTNKNTSIKSITMKINTKTKEIVNKTASESIDAKSNESQANPTQDKPGSLCSGSPSPATIDVTSMNRTTKILETVLLSPSERTNSRSITIKVNDKTNEIEVDKTTSESFDAKSNESQANPTQDKPGSLGSGKGKYACNLCKFRTYKKEYLETHLKVHSSYENSTTKYYACDTCSFTATTRNLLVSHLSTHTKQTFACLICNKTFKYNGALIIHIRRHTGERPFACEYCDKKFPTSYALKTHVRMHTGEKPFSCNVCDKKFTFQCNYNDHVRIHTGEKPYACKTCDSKFKTVSQLKNHNLTHTDEKTYECEICDKKFKGYSHLHNHVKRHKGEKAGGKLAKKVITNKKNAKKKNSS